MTFQNRALDAKMTFPGVLYTHPCLLTQEQANCILSSGSKRIHGEMVSS